MTFQKFVCWDTDMVRRVMDVEATQPANHLFLATHYPVAMYRQELIKASSRVEYDEQKFLIDFIAEKDFAFVPVLGGSGTGKSHLIRWLAANIKSTPQRKVLLIPKIGTNLKDIISLILEGIEGERFDEYRQRVNRATNTLSETQARVQLLNQLAAAVGDNGKRDRSKLTDEQNYLVDELDSLLYDPFFREHWLRDEGIIHRLVIHILGYQDKVEIIEERRQFSLDDLPLDVLSLQKAGTKAREFYAFLIANHDFQKTAVNWLNQHLDEAITQVLNLGREDLQRLMREVRETLAEQGIELVLLIEDFAKLQGIDREVLEAVLARPQQPGSKSLCAIRTALACTTGYFESLIDTVKQRVTFNVNLDIGTVGEQSLMTKADIQAFVARYLNAVRLEEQMIENWVNSDNQEEDYQGEPLTSACNECENRLACHTGFGNMNGVGFYPFTPKALEQMFSRVNPGNFNPRILIKDVLKYTLENSVEDIKNGQFPSTALRQHFGKMRLTAKLQLDIKAKDSQNFERRETLLDLWTDGNELWDLRTEIHTAFDLPPLGVKIHETEISQKPPANGTAPPGSGNGNQPESYTNPQVKQLPDTLTAKLKNLDGWNNQEILPDSIAKDIREFIFPAIAQRIEWDTEMLLKSTFAGSGKLFQQRNIIFHNPKVKRGTYSGFVLSLPLNPNDSNEFKETAFTFQGILLYSHHKNWKFPDGDRYFRTYTRYLERWSQYVLEQIRLYPRESGEPWNPVPATVELLAIAATMAGHSTNTLENVINALFLGLDNKEDLNRASSWKKLFDSFKKNREALLEIVKSRIPCTKGSNSTFQVIDAVQIIEPLKQVLKSWQPQYKIPEDIRDNFAELYKVRQQVDELLKKAIQEECDRQLTLYHSLVSELGEDIKKKDIINIVQQSMQAARNAAVFRGVKSFDELNLLLEKFEKTNFSSYIDTMKRLQKERENSDKETGKLLQYLSENYQKAMSFTSEFVTSTRNFADASLTAVDKEIEALEKSGGATVELSHQIIQDGLVELCSLLTQIKEETNL
ncbi:hypothetical protein G7B40_021535 [Aetokthonos hydrillicola Thurmond2011]|jgi:hypothetical protein|uniref:Uncharacterized protein n=1 Tax=Aetokthonos hydrillicola Thurmond2011 TaxID=2712845 RepID=A0AAP5M6L0_9CYAN|nr:protein DpdH [Aetokthonos hydrillicola]MBO3457752.1 hypothetical protein [Aetokthonos hydrillicola CCALA 1050]MBW4589397.1 hypothetical protein [Aetokthonos hydrillicola CCALA 1050]MDR9897126.1 hypothetical protein [Aetokthonos hydrillicola Thurmond2011]